MGDVVLQQDEHNRGQRDHPEQQVAVLSAGGDVRSPVAGVDKTNGD